LEQSTYIDLRERYEDLMFYISARISGDVGSASPEDNVQELWVSLMSAVETFGRLNGYDSYEEFKDDSSWNKYAKTALWNSKNSRGKRISKKYNITRDTVSTHGNEEVLQMADAAPDCLDTNMYIEELSGRLGYDEICTVRAILENPGYVKANGKLNRLAIGKDMGWTWAETDKVLNSLSEKLRNEL